MSWKPEVQTDSSGKWYGNPLRFATYEEAYASVQALAMRWLAVRDFRATECDDPVTNRLVDGRLESVPHLGTLAHGQGWPREACPFYRPDQEEDRSNWLSQWDLAEHFIPQKNEG